MSNVVTLYDTNFRDIPSMLRKLADDIDSLTYGSAENAAIVLNTDTGVMVFGFGEYSDLETVGALTVGTNVLSRILSEDLE